MTEKIRRRALALARMGAGEGAEAEGARRRLEKMIAEHPDLAYLLADGALATTTAWVDVPTPMHGNLLILLANSDECEVLHVEAEGDPEAPPHAWW